MFIKQFPPPQDSPIASIPPVAVLDPRVLNAVLLDLLTHRGDRGRAQEQSPVLLGPDRKLPAFLRFDPFPCPYPLPTGEAEWDSRFEERERAWARFVPDERRDLNTAAQHIVARIKDHDLPASGFRPVDRRVLLPGEKVARGQEEEVAPSTFLRPRPIQAWPPGYSSDRRRAVVALSIPWGRHTATGGFALTNLTEQSRGEGQWVIKLRWFRYYV